MKQFLGSLQIILMCLAVIFPVVGFFGAPTVAMSLIYFILTAMAIGGIIEIRGKLEDLND